MSSPEIPSGTLRDKYPAFAAIGGRPGAQRSRSSPTRTCSRCSSTTASRTPPPNADASKPKRVLAGDNTLIEFQSGLYIDPTERRHLRAEQRHRRHAGRLRAGQQRRRGAEARAPHAARHVRHRRRREAQRDVPDHPARFDRRRVPQGRRQGRSAAAAAAGRRYRASPIRTASPSIRRTRCSSSPTTARAACAAPTRRSARA